MIFVYPQPGDDEIKTLRAEGKSYRQVAYALGLPLGTVASRIRNIRRLEGLGPRPYVQPSMGEALREQRLKAEAERHNHPHLRLVYGLDDPKT